MANITDVEFSVDRSSFSGGSICKINYYYLLHCDNREIESDVAFSVWCEVWGRERLGDRLLGNAPYDTHNINAELKQRQTREFIIPCELLNDRIGRDAVFITVKARSSFGAEIEASSNIVKDCF